MQGVISTATTRGIGLRLAVIASAFVAGAAPAGAGPADPAPGRSPDMPTFEDVLEVTVVDLEVVVTHEGERVEGLSAADFELFVDGDPVPISYFTEVRAGLAVSPRGEDATPPEAEGEPAGTRYVVFIDDFFSMPTRRDRALAALEDQLALLGPDDRMAVVAFDGRRIDLLSGWTRSTEELDVALSKARDRTAYGLRRMSEIRRLGAYETESHGFEGATSLSTSFSSIGFLGAGRGGHSPELQPGQEVTGRISQVMRAAAATLRGFSQAPERKVMLLFSGCWPAFAVDSTDPPSDLRRDGGRFGAGSGRGFSVFRPLVDTANRLGFTLYPVDLNADAGFPSRSAEHSTPEAFRMAAARNDLVAGGGDALFLLADATGGRAIEGPSSHRALARAVDDTRSYYRLGFAPRWRGDGETHRVDVRTRRQGLEVRSRTELADLDRKSEVDLLVEGAQLFDRPLPGEGEIGAELGEVSRAGRGRIRVPLKLTIPLDKVTLVPQRGGYAARLELRVAARNEEGLLADVPVMPVEILRSEAPAAGEVEVHEVELKLRREPYQLIVALYDPLTTGLLSKRLELEQ